MIAIVESGSTKTDWRFLDQAEIRAAVTTMGFNPYHVKEQVIEQAIREGMNGKVSGTAVKKIYFYGSGCSDPLHNAIIERAVGVYFTEADIVVNHDLLAAARSTCGQEAGISCILGTGSNSCLYDGKKIIDNVANLSYVLGDEGSGNDLGKRLIRSYFYRELPAKLAQSFEAKYGGDRKLFLKRVYETPGANVFLASFAQFLADHRSDIFIKKMLNDSFSAFIRRHICKYDQYDHLPIHFVGSIAHHFRAELKKALLQQGLHLGKIIEKPIEDLVNYHRQH